MRRTMGMKKKIDEGGLWSRIYVKTQTNFVYILFKIRKQRIESTKNNFNRKKRLK